MAKQRASKDKRQAKNRARREATAARAEIARARVGDDASSGSSSGTKPAKKGLFSRFSGGESSGSATPSKATSRSDRAARPAPIRGKPEGPMPRNDKGQVVGHRAALFAFVFALAAVVLLLFVPIPIDRNIDTPADAPPGCEVETTTTTEPAADATDESGDAGDDSQLTCRDSVTIPDELGLIAYPILLLPVAITGIGFWATTRDRQSRIWTFCLVGLAVFLVVFTIGGLLFVPSMVALTIASFQSRRAEQQLLQAQRAAGADDPAEPIETTAEERDEPEPADEVDGGERVEDVEDVED